MGIRNSFGITVDPVTGNLWDTENGDDSFDEINLVPENFNSGWIEIMGITKNQTLIDFLPKYGDFVYSNPEFVWEKPVCPTGIAFSTSEKFAQTDTVFVGDCNNGNLYRFNLNEQRTGFVFDSPFLQDNILNNDESNQEILFGTGFGAITDVKEGPDGFLYIVSLSNGKIYIILPKEMDQPQLPGQRRGRGNQPLVGNVKHFKVYFRFDDAGFEAAKYGVTNAAPLGGSVRDATFLNAQASTVASAWDYVTAVMVCMTVETDELGITDDSTNTKATRCPTTEKEAEEGKGDLVETTTTGKVQRTYAHVFTVRSRATASPALTL